MHSTPSYGTNYLEDDGGELFLKFKGNSLKAKILKQNLPSKSIVVFGHFLLFILIWLLICG